MVGLCGFTRQTSFHGTSRRPCRQSQVVACQRKQIVVCTNTQCKRKGGAATLKLFQEMSPPAEVKIIGQNCLDECPMGPNAGIEDDVMRVFNNVKTKDDVAKILRRIGVEPVEPVDTSKGT